MSDTPQPTNVFEPARELDERPAPLPVPERALTIGAHPDDAEFGAGGTIARWTAAGAEVHMLIVTDGSKGTWDPDLSPGELIDRRKEEQRRAADRLGVAGVVFLDRTDGELVYDMALREEVCLWIRRIRPTIVLGHDPWRRYMLHPDHRAAGWATVDGVVAARDHLFFVHQLALGLEKHRPDHLLLWAADEPDHWEDISETFDVKIAALLEHSTQAPTTMGDATADEERRAAFVDRMRRWSAKQGEPVGLTYAEAFKRITP